jgi:hypothetical protein
LKKYLTLLALLFCVKSAMADTVIISSATPSQPLLVHDDASIEREFQNVYQQIARISSSTTSSIASSIIGNLLQTQCTGGGGGSSTTSATFQPTHSVTITTSKSSSCVLFFWNSVCFISAGSGHLALFRDSTDLSGATNDTLFCGATTVTPAALTYWDCPGKGTFVYQIKMANDGVNTTTVGIAGVVTNECVSEFGL